MRILRSWWRRREDDLEAEIQSHLAMAMRDRMERGETEDQAARAVRREFGNVGLVKEVTRDMWGWVSLDRLIQDVRFSLRIMLKNPGFTVVAVVTLALGIGANTAIFGLLDKVLIRSLPVDQPQQIVSFAEDAAGTPAVVSYPVYTELRDRNEMLSGLVGFFQQPFSLSNGTQSDHVIGQIVTGNYFDVLGVRPALGRFFLPEEDRTPGTHPVVVIGHKLWRQRFGADPAVIGKSVILNEHSYIIVGVTPAEFTGTTRGTVNDVYLPMMMQAQTGPRRDRVLDNRNFGWLSLIGRLKPNISRTQAQAALASLVDNETQSPGRHEPGSIFLIDGSRGHMDRVNDLSMPLLLLMGVAGFVLLIACANIANLLLARASARRREIAVRLAVGAGRFRIIRQLLTESTILSALAAITGVLVAFWFTRLLLGFQQQTNRVPRTLDGSLDHRALLFTLGLSLLTGILFGLAPAIHAAKPDLVSALKEDTPRSGSSFRRFTLRHFLVVTQASLSLVLLIGAGLCVKSLLALQAVDPGLEPSKVLTASFDLSLNGYDEQRGRQFISELTERARSLPGVEAASFATIVAFSDSFWISGATPEGYQPEPDETLAFDFNAVSPGYFRTVGSQIFSGREFTALDTRESPRVVIVNEATARGYWPGQEAVGKRFVRGKGQSAHFFEIVGVVRDSKEKGLTKDAGPAICLPLLQQYVPELTLHLRTGADSQTLIGAIRREVQILDSGLPVYNLQTLEVQKDGSLYNQRLAATLLTLFGLLALLLAAMGIYGVLSYSVTERTREMGIRLALGAQPRDVLNLIVRQGMVLVLIGLAIGVVAALELTRFIGTLLFGVSATDPFIFASIPLLLLTVSLLACWIPARRATRVDPLVALRYE